MNETFSLSIQTYQGPLEALLDLIEDRKLSISDVSLAEVTDAYLSYVEKLPELPLGETAQFILVASTLLLIKSRSLLPSVELSDEENRSIEELEMRLKRYAIYRKASRLLKATWDKTPFTFPKKIPSRPAVFNPSESSCETILITVKRLLETLPKPEKMVEASVAPVLALEDVIVNIKDKLSRAIKARFKEITAGAERHEVIVYFLAMLELVRSGSISVTQERIFDDIHLESESHGIPRYG